MKNLRIPFIYGQDCSFSGSNLVFKFQADEYWLTCSRFPVDFTMILLEFPGGSWISMDIQNIHLFFSIFGIPPGNSHWYPQQGVRFFLLKKAHFEYINTTYFCSNQIKLILTFFKDWYRNKRHSKGLSRKKSWKS